MNAPAIAIGLGLAALLMTKKASAASGLQLSAAGLDLIRAFEGFSATAYQDGRGRTIGYGHQLQPGETLTTLTKAEAEALLKTDTAKYGKQVAAELTRRPTQNQFDALVSLAYNIGLTAFARSTLLTLYNSGDVAGAAAQFPKWAYSLGKTEPALVDRRKRERALFER